MDQKRARLSVSEDDVDRLSKLPDEILSHILSYVATKYSVRTRILSKRWKYVYTLVPVIDLYGPLNCTPETIGPFVEFVNFVLNSYNVDRMDKFIYSSSSFLSETEGAHLVSWIQNVVNRGVRELIVTEILNTPQTLPHNVLTSETITVLTLHGFFNLDVPDNVWLPNLKVFDLLGVIFLSNDSVRRLFLGCPVLEDLFLNNCHTTNVEVIHICSPSLVKLRILGLKDEYELVLDVPNVSYFQYLGFESLGFSMKSGLKSLVDANISFPSWTSAGFESLPNLIRIVSHVQRIRLCAYTLEACRRFGQQLPTFNNLTSLSLSINSSYGFDMELLVNLLDSTPHLDFLTLDNEKSSEFEPNPILPVHVPMCVSTHLKVIEFKGFSMLVYQCTLVEYFLKNAKILETLYIKSEGCLEKQYETSKKLLSFSRCSKACQVIISSDEGER